MCVNVSFIMIFGGIKGGLNIFLICFVDDFFSIRHGTSTRNGESTGCIYIYIYVCIHIYIYIYTCGNIVFLFLKQIHVITGMIQFEDTSGISGCLW